MLFKDDLCQASEHGTCNVRLHALVKIIDSVIQGDVQMCEGMNSMIKMQSDRNPNISLDLLSSRVCLKKQLFASSEAKGSATRSERVVNRAGHLLSQCLDHEEAAKDVLASGYRFGTADPLSGLPHPQGLSSTLRAMFPWMKPTPAQTWGSNYNLIWHREFKEPTFDVALAFGEAGPGNVAYLCADKWHSAGCMVKCRIVDRLPCAEGNALEVQLPYEFTPSIDMFAVHFEAAEGGAEIEVQTLELQWILGHRRAAVVGVQELFVMKKLTRKPRKRKRFDEGDDDEDQAPDKGSREAIGFHADITCQPAQLLHW